MALKIGIFSLKDNVGCTSIAIHMANYLAGGENTVSIIEPDSVKDPEFNTAKADFKEDKTFVINNVRYYPFDASSEPNEDIQIVDYRTVDYMFKFPKDISKLYLCVSDMEEDITDVIDFINETGTEFETILIGGTKNLLQKYSDLKLRCIIVPDKKEERINRMLADRLNFVLRRQFLKPPIYHNDWTYAPTIFHYEPEDESNKGFFNFLGGKKKKTVIEEKIDDEKEENKEDKKEDEPEIVDSGIKVSKKKLIKKATVFNYSDFDFDMSSIPAPIAPIISEENNASNKSENQIAVKEKTQEIKTDKKEQSKVRKLAEKEEKERIKTEKLEVKRLEQEKKNKEITAKKEAERIAKLEADKKLKQEDEARKLKEKEERELKRKEDAKKRRKFEEAQLKEKQEQAAARAERKRKSKERMEKDDLFKESEPDEPLYIRNTAIKILGESMEKEIFDRKNDISNIYIATYSRKLFIFDNVELFYSKLRPLRREVKKTADIHYMLLTFKDNVMDPIIISDDNDLDNIYKMIKPINDKLDQGVLTDNDIKEELMDFDEVLVAAPII